MTVTDNLPAVQNGGTLAIQPDQAMWTPEQRAVLVTLGIGPDCTNAELAGYLHFCQRRSLDPFLKQVYLIGRYDKREGRNVYRPQTGIDGFRVIARRSADKSGIDYEYEDTAWYDAEGNTYDVWLSADPPVAAKVAVVRNGRRFSAVARYAAYVDLDREGKPKNQWKTNPDGQIEKCAEAKALRRAFPEDLGGLYSDVELEHLEEETPADTIPGRTIRDTVAAKDAGENGNGMATRQQRNQIVQLLSSNGIVDPAKGLIYMAIVTGRDIARSDELTGAEAAQVMSALNRGAHLDDPRFASSTREEQGAQLPNDGQDAGGEEA